MNKPKVTEAMCYRAWRLYEFLGKSSEDTAKKLGISRSTLFLIRKSDYKYEAYRALASKCLKGKTVPVYKKVLESDNLKNILIGVVLGLITGYIYLVIEAICH